MAGSSQREGLYLPSRVPSLSFSTPFVCAVNLDGGGAPIVTGNSMFTEVQEESAGVNQSTEGAGDLTSHQPHWVSQNRPSGSGVSEDGWLVDLPAMRHGCPLNDFGFPRTSECSFSGFSPF